MADTVRPLAREAENVPTARRGMLPTFVVIGPGKAGTTWLYECLREHPEICMARGTKETIFFQDYYERGLDWYKGFFRACGGAKAVGEVSNTYFFSDAVPQRMHEAIPDARLVTILRDPVERLYSLYLFRRRDGSITTSLEQAIADDPRLIEDNFYFTRLQKFLEYFPRERLFIALYDDVKAEPERLIREIYAFLGVDPDFRPARLDERVLPASAPRNAFLFHQLKRLALWLRRSDLHAVLSWGKSSRLVNRLLLRPYVPGERPEMAAATRARLRAVYREEIDKLAHLLGRDLSHWS